VATEALAKLANSGTVRRIGVGKKGNPYRYYKPTPDDEKDSSETPVGSERMNTGASTTTGQIHSFATPSLGADE
jgi:hypothetical protein